MANSRCPVCGLEVRLPSDVMPGEVVEHDCGATLEVVEVSRGQLGLRVLEGLEEDWGE
ncbi:MAG: sulfonate ABC transporter [Desulfurococcales archaeon]|nr:sulfonate ABC transporter [Desulfurococcales archaeon]